MTFWDADFVLTGANDAITTAGDIDGDGLSDIAVGETSSRPGAHPSAAPGYVAFPEA